MESLTLSEYLNLDIKDKSNLDDIFHYTDNYLNDLQTNNFPESKVSIIDSIVDKYVDCGINILYKSDELDELKNRCIRFKEMVTKGFYRSPLKVMFSFISISKDNTGKYNNEFNRIYGIFISSYKKIIEDRKYFEFEGYFKPNNSTKDRIKFLIEKCIKLIEDDETLKPKAKEKFIKEFTTILRQLNSPFSNWTIILGKVKEAIFVMGALGGIATGAINVMNEYNNIQKPSLLETVGVLHEIEEEIVNSYQVTPDEFNETFTFGNRIGMRAQNVEFIPLALEPPKENEKKDIPLTEFTDIEIINEEE